MIRIYFDTASFDLIEKDVKVTVEGSLGLIGGTMGLFTGFSVLSGAEIIYFVIKFLCSFRYKMMFTKKHEKHRSF